MVIMAKLDHIHSPRGQSANKGPIDGTRHENGSPAGLVTDGPPERATSPSTVHRSGPHRRSTSHLDALDGHRRSALTNATRSGLSAPRVHDRLSRTRGDELDARKARRVQSGCSFTVASILATTSDGCAAIVRPRRSHVGANFLQWPHQGAYSRTTASVSRPKIRRSAVRPTTSVTPVAGSAPRRRLLAAHVARACRQ